MCQFTRFIPGHIDLLVLIVCRHGESGRIVGELLEPTNSGSAPRPDHCAPCAPPMAAHNKDNGSPYSIIERRVPELFPVLGTQPAGDVSHKPGGRLPLLSTRAAVPCNP